MSKRKDGRYCVTARINGKRRFFYGETKREAAALREAALEDAARHPYADKKITLSEYLAAWLSGIRDTVTEKTLESYAGIIRRYFVRAPIGSVVLEDLTPSLFRQYWADLLGRGLSPRTVIYCHTLAGAALKQAVFDGILTNNPLAAVRRPKLKRPERRALSPEDVRRVLAAVEDQPMVSRIFRVALATGLRREELLGLRWSDLDLKAGRLSVEQAVIIMQGRSAVIVPELKNKSSRRTISIGPETVAVFHAQRAYVLGLCLKRKAPAGSCALVFPSQALTPLSPANVSRAAHSAFVAAGLSGFTFHSFRHTHASRLIAAGVNYKIVQARLGHASFSTTMDIYSHVSPGADAAAAALIEKVL